MRKLRKLYALDARDEQLLRVLTKDGRIQEQELSKILGISRPAATARRKAMEKAGIIKGYSVIVDWDKVAEGDDIAKEVENEGREGDLQNVQMEQEGLDES